MFGETEMPIPGQWLDSSVSPILHDPIVRIFMTAEPNLHFDIDALFQQLEESEGHDLNEPLTWVFTICSDEVSKLEAIQESVGDEFATHLEDAPFLSEEEGEDAENAPLLLLLMEGCLSKDDVKKLAKQVEKLAVDNQCTYDGVRCFGMIEEGNLFDWMNLEEGMGVIENLQAEGAATLDDLPWAFLVMVDDADQLEAVSEALEKVGLEDVELFDNSDDESDEETSEESDEDMDDFGACVFYGGSHDPAKLELMWNQLTELVSPAGGSVEGVQFFTRDYFLEAISSLNGDDEEAE